MNIGATYKGRVQIIGKRDDTRGYTLSVRDSCTGEPIHNIKRVVLILSADSDNRARITYFDNKNDKYGNARELTINFSDIDLDITAIKIDQPDENKEQK